MLSVVLTSYNYARFLPAALGALAAQTRQPDELIIIDDASSDDSVAVIASLLGHFADARLIRNKANQGPIANLNRGLNLARGEIVFFAAADDIAHPSLFKRGMELLAAHPEAALFSARTHIIGVDGVGKSTLATAVPLRSPGFIPPDAIARQLMRDDNWLTGNTTLYRRAALAAAGGFAAELGSFCDGYVSRLLALRHGACYSPEVLGAWRRHPGGYAWSQTTDLPRVRELAAAVSERIEADGGFPPGYARRWARRYLFGARRFTLAEQTAAARSRGPLALGLARVRELSTGLALFAAYRPWDFTAVARRRLSVLRRPPDAA